MKGIKNYTLFILMNFIILVANAETYIVTADKLNVRSEASKTGDIIETFQQGDAVTVEEISGDWATVDINGEKGYVSTQYLASSESGQKSKETKKNLLWIPSVNTSSASLLFCSLSQQQLWYPFENSDEKFIISRLT